MRLSAFSVGRVLLTGWVASTLALGGMGCAGDEDQLKPTGGKRRREQPTTSSEPTPVVQPVVPVAGALSAIWGSAPNDVWIVGLEGTILHYNGKDLIQVQSPTNVGLLAVHGSAYNDIWMVGEAAVTVHWN